VITEYPIPTSNSGPAGITQGSDGNLWFTEYGGNKIGRITTAGAITEYPVPRLDSWLAGITQGPDGNLWFAEFNGFRIGKISTSGAITEYPLPNNPPRYPSYITQGPNGNLWFSEAYFEDDGHPLGGIGTITTSGSSTTEFGPDYGFGANGITTGPDGNFWLTDTSGSVGRIAATNGQFKEFQVSSCSVMVPVPQCSPVLGTITPGPDGNLWFTESDVGRVGRITTGGEITEFDIPTDNPSGVGPYAIIQGPDGNLWMTEQSTNSIGRLVLSLPPPQTARIANAASGAQGLVAPGEIISVTGSGLGPPGPLGAALNATGMVPTTMGSVSVSFNGYPAPLLYVSDSQINCVAPYELTGVTNPWMQVIYAGQTSAMTPLIAADSDPGVFTVDSSGVGQGAILNTAGCPGGAAVCPNNSSQPAPQGSIVVLYLTGEGQTSPGGVTGRVTTIDTFPYGPLTPQPLLPLAVTIGGIRAAVKFYGEAPGMVAGVLQVNVELPSGLPSGNQPVLISVGVNKSREGVTVAVQ
jgi:uncharacterized protein (TIGR03437 family)